jgi:hypothetical protein
VSSNNVAKAADAAFAGPCGTEKTLSENKPYRYKPKRSEVWLQRYCGVADLSFCGLQAQFAKIIGKDNAQYEAKVAEQRRTSAEALAANSASAQSSAAGGQAGFVRNDPATLAARRCLESGRSDMECIGQGLKTGLADVFGGVVGGTLGSSISRGFGYYRAATEWRFQRYGRPDVFLQKGAQILPAAA